MTPDRRRDSPSTAAKEYLPYPGDGFGTYVVVSAAAFAVGLFFFGKFYGVNISDHPILAFVGGGLIVCLSCLLRWRRVKRHKVNQN